jgi:hypothetical protein
MAERVTIGCVPYSAVQSFPIWIQASTCDIFHRERKNNTESFLSATCNNGEENAIYVVYNSVYNNGCLSV